MKLGFQNGAKETEKSVTADSNSLVTEKPNPWEAMDEYNILLYTEGAYLDQRRGQAGKLRLLIYKNHGVHHSGRCLLINEDGSEQWVKGEFDLINRNAPFCKNGCGWRYEAYFYNCNASGITAEVPKEVKLEIKVFAKPERVPQTWPNATYQRRLYPQSFKKLNRTVLQTLLSRPITPVSVSRFAKSPTLTLGICTKAMYQYKEWSRLLLFILYHQYIGASKFIFYKHSTSRDVDRVLDYFVKKELVEIVYWPSFPRPEIKPSYYDTFQNLSKFGQIIAHNDCLLRLSGKIDFVALIDLDEFVSPNLTHPSVSVNMSGALTSVISSVVGEISETSRAAALRVRSSFVQVEWPPEKSIQDTDLQNLTTPPIFDELTPNRLNSPGDRAKMIAKPERIEKMTVHNPYRFEDTGKPHTDYGGGPSGNSVSEGKSNATDGTQTDNKPEIPAENSSPQYSSESKDPPATDYKPNSETPGTQPDYKGDAPSTDNKPEPPVTEDKPEGTDYKPNEDTNKSNETDPNSDSTGTQPDYKGDAPSTDYKPEPPTTEDKPEGTDYKPNEDTNKSNETDPNSDSTGTQPDYKGDAPSTDYKPEPPITENKPEGTDYKPNEDINKSNETDPNSDSTGTQPDYKGDAPSTDYKPEPPTTEDKPEGTDYKPNEDTNKSNETDPNSDSTGTQPDYKGDAPSTDYKPEPPTTEDKPEGTDYKPNEDTNKSNETDPNSDSTGTQPDYKGDAPSTDYKPEPPTTEDKPEGTDYKPNEDTNKSNETDPNSDSTGTQPDYKGDAPSTDYKPEPPTTEDKPEGTDYKPNEDTNKSNETDPNSDSTGTQPDYKGDAPSTDYKPEPPTTEDKPEGTDYKPNENGHKFNETDPNSDSTGTQPVYKGDTPVASY